MKFCVIAQRVPYPPNKGEKLRTYHHIKHLVRQGHVVEVWTLIENEEEQEFASALSVKLNIPVHTFSLPARWRRYGWALLNRQAISSGAFYAAGLLNKLVEKSNSANDSERFDVIYLSASSLVYYIKRLKDKTPVMPHVIADFMDVDSDKWAQYAATSYFPFKWVYQRESTKVKGLETFANEYFDATFLIAEEETALFASTVTNKKPVTVLGNGMAFDEFYPPDSPPQSTPAVFLFTGVMDYKPNVDAVVWFAENCWPHIVARFPDSQFLIVGMNPTKQVLALSSLTGIEVTGFVDDILPYYHKAVTFVAPFRLARGVQNKVLQAVATGLRPCLRRAKRSVFCVLNIAGSKNCSLSTM